MLVVERDRSSNEGFRRCLSTAYLWTAAIPACLDAKSVFFYGNWAFVGASSLWQSA